ADVGGAEPGLVVVLDPRPPTLNLQLLTAGGEGMVVACDIRDDNLDVYKKRVEYQTADKQWRVMEPMPGRPDQYCIPRQAMFTGFIRLSAVDLANNTAIQEFNVAAMEQPTGAPANPQGPGPRPEPIKQVQHAP